MTNTLLEKWNVAEEAAKAYVEGCNNPERLKKSEIKKLKSDVTSALKDFNNLVEIEHYQKLGRLGNPVKSAIFQEKIPEGRKFSFSTDDNNVMKKKLVEYDIKMSLPMMQHVLGDEIFESQSWFEMARTLMYCVIDNIGAHIGVSCQCDVDTEKVFGFKVNPCNTEDCIKALNKVYEAILIIPDKDGNNILQTSTKKDGYGNYYSSEWKAVREALSYGIEHGVGVTNTTKFTEKLLETMHIMMHEGKGYSLFELEEEDLPEVETEEAETEVETEAEDKTEKAE